MKEKIAYRWAFDEFEQHHRSTMWYVIAGLVVGILLVYSIATSNLLFGVLIFLGTAVLFIRHSFRPQEIVCEIGHKGILLGSKVYSFADIEYFSIIQNSVDETVLYIREARGLKSNIPIPLPEDQEDEIREFLEQFIEEDTEHQSEPLWDWIMRKLKL